MNTMTITSTIQLRLDITLKGQDIIDFAEELKQRHAEADPIIVETLEGAPHISHVVSSADRKAARA